MKMRTIILLWKKHCEFKNPPQQEVENINQESNDVEYIDEMPFWDL